jgi:hypothetical protein
MTYVVGEEAKKLSACDNHFSCLSGNPRPYTLRLMPPSAYLISGRLCEIMWM